MRVTIGEDTYDMRSASELSLLDLLTLERETRDLGRPLSMAVLAGMERSVTEAVAAVSTIADKRRVRTEHPESAWLLGVQIWAARRAAGEHITFAEAISFPLSSLTFTPEAGDPVDSDDVDPQPARPVSGRAAKPRAPRKTTNRSVPRSTTG